MTKSGRAKKPSQPKPVYVVYGEDDFRKSQTVNEIIRETIGEEEDEFAYVKFDDQPEISEVVDELRTRPMFSRYRLVAVMHADGFVSAYRAALEEYCGDPSPSASLLLVCRGFRKNTRIYKRVQSVGSIIECKPPRTRDFSKWIGQRAQQQYGKAIDKDAAEALHVLIGDDLGTLDQELGKLATYLGKREKILLEDVSVLVGLHRQEIVFGLTDALMRKHAAEALRLWDRVWLSNRSAPYVSIGGLAWALRRDLSAKLNSGDLWGLKKAYWGKSPEQLEEIRACLETRSIDEFENSISALAQADMDTKTGLTGTRLGIEKFIVKQCT